MPHLPSRYAQRPAYPALQTAWPLRRLPLQLFRWRLEDSDILRLTLLVHFILTRVIASITILPGVLDTSQPTETEPEVR